MMLVRATDSLKSQAKYDVVRREVGVGGWGVMVRRRRVLVHCLKTGSSSSASARCLMLESENVC